MSQYILINRIQVQNANAVAGFTWGFPAITHFLGFVHALQRQLAQTNMMSDIEMQGCAVIAHTHQTHTYKSGSNILFTQSRNPPYLPSHDKQSTPPVIEEGKMNLTVSLLIELSGSLGNQADMLIAWLNQQCFMHRLAGGTILSIKGIEAIRFNQTETDKIALARLKSQLLPSYVLMDRSGYLDEYFRKAKESEPNSQLLDAWADFIALKQKARPKSDLLHDHLKKFDHPKKEGANPLSLYDIWQKHLSMSYQNGDIPAEITAHFQQLPVDKQHQKLLVQWQAYSNPTEKTESDWEYVPKPRAGYLIPIMCGYKAITPVFDNQDIAGTRDNHTPVCFVEAVHSIGEWLSVHRVQDINTTVWRYHTELNWYLCRQDSKNQPVDMQDDLPFDLADFEGN